MTSQKTGNDEVQFYSATFQELKYSQKHKAQKFLENKCIQYDFAEKRFICLPIKGYNSTTYFLERAPEEPCGFRCNCQHFVMQKKKGGDPRCSHIGALKLWFEQRNKEHGWGKYAQTNLNGEIL